MLPVAEIRGSRRRLTPPPPPGAITAGHAPAWPSSFQWNLQSCTSQSLSLEHPADTCVRHPCSAFSCSRCSLAACNRGGDPPAAPAPAAGAVVRRPPPASRIVTLQDKPIEVASDFISTVRSLHSTTIQPQVDGRVTKIYVKSGDVGPRRHAAASRSIRRSRPRRCATPSRSAPRAKPTSPTGRRRSSGCSRCSRPARSARTSSTPRSTTSTTAQANLAALDAQVREGTRAAAVLPRHRADDRRRRRHRGPRRGSHHDLDGDHDHRRQERARGLHPGAGRSRARRCGSACRRRSSTPTARSSRPTRSRSSRRASIPRRRRCSRRALLRERAADMKLQQFVKIRVIWRSVPGLDDSDHRRRAHQRPVFLSSSPNRRPQGLVARQHPVQVGEVQGNDYVVTGGLKAGRPADRRRASRRSPTARP